jgi:DNA-binding NtrC family response regulator
VSTLLLIDDDPTVVGILYELLCENYECHTADRAEQALQYVEVQKYDVVITDISMPGLGGFEILKHLNERQPATPVIIISGMGDEEKDRLISMGAFAFFRKPFRLEEVEDAIVRAIASKSAKQSST